MSQSKKKHPSVADGMDKTGWVVDTWHPYMGRGYWHPMDKKYTPPLIPQQLNEKEEWSSKQMWRNRLINELRHEQMRIAEEKFRRACRYVAKRKK